MPSTLKTNPHSSPESSVISLRSQRLAARKEKEQCARGPSKQRGAKKNHQPKAFDTAVIDDTFIADMPSLLSVGDVILGKQRYPSRVNRTPALAPPAIIHPSNKPCASLHATAGNLSQIVDSPPFEKKRVGSTYANNLEYSDDDNDFLLCDDELHEDTEIIEYMDTK